MDRSLRLREAHRGAAGPPHPSGSHPGNERGELSPGPKPKTQSGENPRREYPLSTITPKNHEKTPPRPHHLWPQMVHFYAALPVHFSSGLDTARNLGLITKPPRKAICAGCLQPAGMPLVMLAAGQAPERRAELPPHTKKRPEVFVFPA